MSHVEPAIKSNQAGHFFLISALLLVLIIGNLFEKNGWIEQLTWNFPATSKDISSASSQVRSLALQKPAWSCLEGGSACKGASRPEYVTKGDFVVAQAQIESENFIRQKSQEDKQIYANQLALQEKLNKK